MTEQRPIESEMLTGSAMMIKQLAWLLANDLDNCNRLNLQGLMRAVLVLERDCNWVAGRVEELMVENHALKKQLEAQP